MRTKTLLLIAAACAAGAVSSMAQVYSVNAVGYVNKTVAAGQFALISNPLNAATNTVNALFTPVPDGFQVYIYVPGKGYAVGTYDSLSEGFIPDAVGNAQVTPGMGVFVKNPPGAATTVTFVGEVPQGTLTTQLVAGLQIVSSQVPQAGNAKSLGLQGADGDQIYIWDTSSQKYQSSTFDALDNDWSPKLETLKQLDVGDAFFLKKVAAGTWTRTFSVNNP